MIVNVIRGRRFADLDQYAQGVCKGDGKDVVPWQIFKVGM